MKNFFLFFLGLLLLHSCARVGSPVGGKKDSIAPILIGSNIDSPRINVSRNIKELRLDFDEYITLDKITKNLIISPPIKKIKKILPSSIANKYVLIQWSDTLQANTTYNFNFGNSIKDNNEGNVLKYFNFAFSTGEKIDDLYISGETKNLVKPKSTNSSGSASKTSNLVVGLYKDSDSINYKEKPYYITMADPDGYYELNYLSKGNYKILAFEDVNENSVFDTGSENVAFLKDSVSIEANVSGLNLDLYPSKTPFKYKEIKEIPGGILMLFEGKQDAIKVFSVTDELKNYKVTQQPRSDSVFVWFDAKSENIGIEKSNQIKLSYDTPKKQDTVSVFYRMNPKNEMLLSNNGGNLLPPNNDFVFSSNFAIDQIDTSTWTLVSDSISQPFSAKISETNPFNIVLKSDFKQGKKYSLTVPKETVKSYFDKNLKSYRFDFEADKSENYGSITIRLSNTPKEKFWLQLLNSKGDVKYQQYVQNSEIKFSVVKPDTYSVRILVDQNGNGFWDSSDFENQIFSEPAYLFSKKITARPMWEIVENWDLNEKTSAIPKPLETDQSTEIKTIQNPEIIKNKTGTTAISTD